MTESIDLSKVDEILKRYEKKEASLIPVLQEVQSCFRYLPEEALVRIGQKLNIALSRIYGVATFYSQFYLAKRGRHVIRVCRGTACHVRGGKSVLDAIKEYLKIGDGETTPDYGFTLETVACLGSCALAPVLLVDEDYYGKLTPEKIAGIVQRYAEGGQVEAQV